MSRGPGLGRCRLLCLPPGTHPSAAQVQLRGGVLCQGGWGSALPRQPLLNSKGPASRAHEVWGCGTPAASLEAAGCAWQPQNWL